MTKDKIGDDFVGFRVVMRKVMKDEKRYNHFLRPIQMREQENGGQVNDSGRKED